MSSNSCYVEPRIVTNLSDCKFYHTMELPDQPLIEGAFDLRKGIGDYLGQIDFRGKRVLEIGPASGFCTFHMEQQGAEVVSCDLPEGNKWDIVPYAATDWKRKLVEQSSSIERVKNSYWYSHRALGSKAKVVYGDVGNLPDEIGVFDIGVFSAVLLHMRDPFRALAGVAPRIRQTLIVVEHPRSRKQATLMRLLRRFTGMKPSMEFLPNHERSAPNDTWWHLPEDLMEEYMAILGFQNRRLLYHSQRWNRAESKSARFYTMVGERSVNGAVSEVK